MLSGWLTALPGVRLRAVSATGGARRRTIPENSHSRAMRSLRFSTLRLPVSPTGRGRLRCQVQCCTLAKDESGKNISVGNEKHPADAGCLASSAPGRSARASLRPQDAARAEPSQVQCCPWSEFDPKAQHNIAPKRNQPHKCGADFFLESGNVLLSRAVSSQVPSATLVLTYVFGMGTGVSLKRIVTRNGVYLIFD